MKTFKRITAAAILLILWATCAQAADSENLKQLLRLADKNNPVISAQQQKQHRAKAVVNEANAKMLPKITGVYAALWTENPLFDMAPALAPAYGALVGSGLLSPAQVPNVKNPLADKKIFAAAAALTQTIYSGGALPAVKAAAKLGYEAAEAETLRTIQTVENHVRTAYYSYKRAEAKQVVAQDAVNLANDHLSQAEKLFKGGLISKADVLRAKVAVADADLMFIRAKNGLELAHVALERTAGTEIPNDLLAGDSEVKSDNEEIGDLKYALVNRAELKMYDFYSRQAAKIARARQGELLPHILGFAAVANIDNQGWPQNNTEWFAGAAASWKLFDSGEAHARTEQARSQSKELLYRLEDKKNEVKMEVRQAELNLKAAKARFEVAQRQLSESEEDYRIAELRYKENVGTNLDMLDARLALTNSKSNVVDAKYDIALAEANLLFAVGK